MTKSKTSKVKDIADVQGRNVLTQEGYDRIVAELDERRIKVREEIATELEVATEQGDLSENSAYKAALEAKELNEKRIEDLEQSVATAQIIEEDHTDTTVSLGDLIELRRTSDKQKFVYTLVGKAESDPANNKISVDSPVGRALYGAHKGAKITVHLPKGDVEFEVIEVD